MREERTERRTVIMAVAKLAWTDQKGTARQLSVKIEDTSRSGACIRISVPIDVESKLIVDWREGRFSGVAKYCRADGDEYSVGIRRDPFLDAAPAKAITEVTTGGIEPPASENVPDAPAGPGQFARELLTTKTPEETVVVSTVIHRGATHGDEIDSKAESKSDQHVWDVTEREVVRIPERQTGQPSISGERSNMLSKWLKTASKQDRKDILTASSNGVRGSNTGDHARTERQNDIHAIPHRTAPAVPQGDMLPLEDIYRAMGTLDARTGYSVLKVVEMLGSSHIRELPNEMRRASVLMALDAAGISIDEILKDARVRLDALASYETDQEKRLKESESRKLQGNAQIQLEMERVSEHYLERMNRNLDEVALARSPFTNWQAIKQQEVQRISEAVGLCEKRAASEPSSATPSPSEVRAIVVAAKPSELAAKHVSPAASKGLGHGDGHTLDA
jgi:hypothetical protein